jgi:hypothetical protein
MKQIIERLDYLEQVLATIFQEVVQIRTFANAQELQQQLQEQEQPEEYEDQEEEFELSEEELRTAVKEGELAGFIGAMKDFK